MGGRAGPGERPVGVRRRDFPGWRMVWALSVTETVSYGALFSCFAVMVVPVREAFDASTAQVSGALTLAIAVTGLASLPLAARSTATAPGGS